MNVEARVAALESEVRSLRTRLEHRDPEALRSLKELGPRLGKTYCALLKITAPRNRAKFHAQRWDLLLFRAPGSRSWRWTERTYARWVDEIRNPRAKSRLTVQERAIEALAGADAVRFTSQAAGASRLSSSSGRNRTTGTRHGGDAPAPACERRR